jgi:hypothetical protein
MRILRYFAWECKFLVACVLGVSLVMLLPGTGASAQQRLADTRAPETTISSGPANTTNATTATFSFGAEKSATYRCSLDGSAYTSCTSPKSYSGLTVGAHSFKVKAYDKAGNVDPTPAVDQWTVYNHALTNNACTGQQIRPGENIAAVVNGDSTARTWCIQDGEDYTITSPIDAQTNEKFIGVYSDGSRPGIKTTTAKFIFDMSGTSGGYFEGLSISGAQYDNSVTTRAANQGKGIGNGGSGIRVWNVRAHHNENQGIGGTNPDLRVYYSEIDNNGSHEAAADNTGADTIPGDQPVSAAGIKSANSMYIYNSYVHDNYWSGVWCDEHCTEATTAFEVHDTAFVNNGKAGIHYEITEGPAVFEGNTLNKNGTGSMWTDANASKYSQTPKAGIIVSGSQNADIYSNFFATISNGSNQGNASEIKRDANNRLTLSAISVHDNTLGGDTLVGCTLTGVSCTNNSS